MSVRDKLRWNCAWWAIEVLKVNTPKSKMYRMALEELSDYFKKVDREG